MKSKWLKAIKSLKTTSGPTTNNTAQKDEKWVVHSVFYTIYIYISTIGLPEYINIIFIWLNRHVLYTISFTLIHYIIHNYPIITILTILFFYVNSYFTDYILFRRLVLKMITFYFNVIYLFFIFLFLYIIF